VTTKLDIKLFYQRTSPSVTRGSSRRGVHMSKHSNGNLSEPNPPKEAHSSATPLAHERHSARATGHARPIKRDL